MIGLVEVVLQSGRYLLQLRPLPIYAHPALIRTRTVPQNEKTLCSTTSKDLLQQIVRDLRCSKAHGLLAWLGSISG